MVIAIQNDVDHHFLYFFMALGPCIQRFRNTIHPVIIINGTFLKGIYRGALFVAATLDENDKFYLVGLALSI